MQERTVYTAYKGECVGAFWWMGPKKKANIFSLKNGKSQSKRKNGAVHQDIKFKPAIYYSYYYLWAC